MSTQDATPRPVARPRAVVEVLGIATAAMGTFWLARLVAPGWLRWEQDTLGGPWLIQVLALMVVPLILVRLLGLRSGRLGVTFGQIGRPLETALTALAVIGPISGLAFPLLGVLGWSPFDWTGGLVLAAAYAAALPLTGVVIRKIRPSTAGSLAAPQVAIAAAVLAGGVVASALTADSFPLLSRILIALLVVGPGEELLFRGIMQTRLDQAFGRPWRIFGTDLGWGWALASVIFGLAHYLSASAPFQGGWALWTAVSGLLFGYVRAKGGSFVASGLVHGVLLAIAAVFA
ncbi:MAG: type II CAAX endopeptidase family protein [Propioniciclava sp.]|uniref:CPBP family glutamic-type intramembrane protease n=1 Tax=Propioniciclava sp. TaxID=2038686 RepID=UPI0039E3A652